MSQNIDLQVRQHQSRVLMSWLASTGGEKRAGVERLSAVSNAGTIVVSSDSAGMRELFAPISSPSGFAVTDSTAMSVSTVYACMAKIAGAILQLPVHQYKLDKTGDRERIEPTPLWWLLNESPDDAWTAAAWKEWIVRCWGLRGDQVTEILRAKSATSGGAVTGLRPHHPDCVNIRRIGRRLAYDIQDQFTGQQYTLDQDDVLHFSGFGFNGIRSQSVVEWAARTAISNALASADYMGRTIGEGAMPQIALSYPNKNLTPDAQETLRKSFVATYTNTGSRKLPLLLMDGATANVLSISPADLELMAARGFESAQVCEAFGVPPIILGNSEKASSWGTGIEQISIGFVRYTIAPMLARWEEELNRKLFRRAGQFVEFGLAALLRGDSKAKAEAYRSALGGPGTGDGHMSVDEVRKLENMPALGGDFAKPFRAQRGTDKPPDQPADGAPA